MCKEAIQAAITELVQRILNRSICPSDYFFDVPVRANGLSNQREESFSSLRAFLREWIDLGPQKNWPYTAILWSPVGSGKTVESCRAVDSVLSDCTVLWVACREYVRYNPLKDLPDLIRENSTEARDSDLWSEEAGLRCIVLDGFDECMQFPNDPQAIEWLRRLIDRAHQCDSKPRILLTGRDAFLAPSSSSQSVWDILSAYGDLQGTNRPADIKLGEWNANRIRDILFEILSSRFEPDQEEADRRIRLIGRDLLTSPVLYGMACRALLTDEDDQTALNSEWALASRAITELMRRDDRRQRLDHSHDFRRLYAQEISLFLATSSRGLKGCTLEEIRSLDSFGMVNCLGATDKDLFMGCLMMRVEERVAPFHHQILIHLAAEGIDRLKDQDVQYHGEVSKSALSETFLAWWRELADRMGQNTTARWISSENGQESQIRHDALESVLNLLENIIAKHEITLDTPLIDVLRYWIEHRWNIAEFSAANIPPLPTFEDISRQGNERELSNALVLLATIRNCLLRKLTDPSGVHSIPPQRPVPTLIAPDGEYFKHLNKLESRSEFTAVIGERFGPTPVMISLSTTMLFLRDYEPVETFQVIEFLTTEWGVDVGRFELRPLQNYLIDRIEIEDRGRLVTMSEVPSTRTIRSLLEEALETIEGALVIHEDPYCEPNIVVDPDLLLEHYRVVTDSVLRVVGEGRESVIHEGHDQDDSPSSPSSSIASDTRIALPPKSTDEHLRDLAVELRTHLMELPNGEFPVWERSTSAKHVIVHNLDEIVLLSAQTVTVRQYAAFLEANPEIHLPFQEGWSRNPQGRVGFAPAMASQPVVGITWDEARQFASWAGTLFETLRGFEVSVTLPRPEWLQVASHGGQLGDLPIETSGPYGHLGLTGTLWQWTSERDGPDVLAFGGSDMLGDGTPGAAQKTLERNYPDYCWGVSPESRNRHVGLRIAAVLRPVISSPPGS